MQVQEGGVQLAAVSPHRREHGQVPRLREASHGVASGRGWELSPGGLSPSPSPSPSLSLSPSLSPFSGSFPGGRLYPRGTFPGVCPCP